MKISKKTVIALCIIVPILALVLWLNQKPNFSKYHSYAVEIYDKDLGAYKEMPLTDEQFQRIVDVYKNDETLYYEWFEAFFVGYDIHLYKSKDMSGEYDYMTIGSIEDRFLCISGEIRGKTWDKAWGYDKQDTARQVYAIIEEAIEQYESGQE